MSDAFTANVPLPLPEPTQDERTMATLAHVLQIVGGWIAPLIIFFVKADSKFVRFHALQVLLLHICLFVFGLFMALLWVVIMVASILGAVAQSAAHPNQIPFPFGFFLLFPFIWLFAIGVTIFEIILAIVFAIKAGRGEWAEYPLFGRWAKRILKIA